MPISPVLALAPLFAATPVLPATPGGAAEVFQLDHGLTLDLTGLAGIEHTAAAPDGQLVGTWSAQAGEVELHIRLFALERESFGIDEPEDVTWLVAAERDDGLRYEERELLESEFFGWTPYAALARGTLRQDTREVGTFFCLGGIGDGIGYSLEIDARPVPAGGDLEAIEQVLREGLSAEVESRRVAEWTDEEVEARWASDAPDDLLDEMRDVVRTDHYIIFTNSSAGKKFGQKMEECYEEVKAVFPFQEVEGRKLMPVFLFRTREQYAEFYVKVAGISMEQALRSGGHAWRDYYATDYKAPGDPVHVHEATHQIFANRLRLSGGGSWFQEGVAEYVETSERTRKNWAARAAEKGRYMPFEEFFQVPSMLYCGKEKLTGGSESSDNYTQAASIIEFCRDSKWRPEKFQEFVHAVGSVPRGDLAAIEAALARVYGVGVQEFEERWVEYWEKR